MPTVTRPDGVEIAWRERGQGPMVLLANMGYLDPSVLADLEADLATDHRVLGYDSRGAGASSHAGPYEIETDAGDLLAVLEAAGAQGSLVVGNGDGANRSVRAAAERPDLIEVVVVPGNLPMPLDRSAAEGLSSSGSVLKALVTLLETDYRAGVYAFVSSGNPGYDEARIQERVERIVAHGGQEAALGRIRSWIADDPTSAAQQLGDRLWILHHEANPWFAGSEGARKLLPEAHHEQVADGPLERPEQTAAVVRRITRSAAR